MSVELPLIVLSIIGLAAIFAVIGFVLYHLGFGTLKCVKCRIRIASIKVPQLLSPSPRRLEELGDGARFLDSRICSKCWEDDLKIFNFPTIIGWWPGATVEYLKNTPAFLAFLFSIASLALGILNFLR